MKPSWSKHAQKNPDLNKLRVFSPNVTCSGLSRSLVFSGKTQNIRLFLPQTHHFRKTQTGCRFITGLQVTLSFTPSGNQQWPINWHIFEQLWGKRSTPEGSWRRYGPAGRRAQTQGADSKQLSTALRLINQSGSFGEFAEICRGPVVPDCQSKLHMIRLTEWQQTKTSQCRWITEILSFIYLDRLRTREFLVILCLV